MSFGGAFRSSSTPVASDPQDIDVTDPPSESISRVAFSPTADILAVSSWNCEVRLYDVGPAGETRPRALYKHEGPVLDIVWNTDGSKLFSAGADNAVRAFDMNTGQSAQVAAHDAPISVIRWIDSPAMGSFLVTASWDKTLKYWDLKGTAPVATVNLPERCYAMDAVFPLLVVGTADRHILTINLNAPTTIVKQIDSPLKWQTRVIACFPAADGFAVGSIEGRIAIQYIDEKDTGRNFSFKCHRVEQKLQSRTDVYAINAIVFHKQHGTMLTAGGDGTVSIWDKDAKTKLKAFEAQPQPVVSASFSRTGTVLARAVSYDWSKGHSGMTATPPLANKILLTPLKDEDVKKKVVATSGRR